MKLKIDDHEVTVGSNLAYGSIKTLQAPQDWEYRQDGTLRIEQTSAYTRIVYRLPFTFLRDADYQALHDFFITRGGLYKPFVYEDDNGDAWSVRLDSGAYDFRHTDFLRRRGELVLVTQGEPTFAVQTVTWTVARDRLDYQAPLEPVDNNAIFSTAGQALTLAARNSHRLFAYCAPQQPRSDTYITVSASRSSGYFYNDVRGAFGFFVHALNRPLSARGAPLNTHAVDGGSSHLEHPDAHAIVARIGPYNGPNTVSHLRHNNAVSFWSGSVFPEGVYDASLGAPLVVSFRLSAAAAELWADEWVWNGVDFTKTLRLRASLPLSAALAAAYTDAAYRIGFYFRGEFFSTFRTCTFDIVDTNLDLYAFDDIDYYELQ